MGFAASAATAGTYAGIQLGWEKRPSAFGFFTESAEGFSRDDANSLASGAFVGYRLPVAGRLSLSAEAEFGRSNGKSRLDDIPGVRIDSKSTWNYLASGRLGVLLTDTVEAYGLAGYGGQRLKFRYTSDGTTLPPDSVADTDWKNGFAYGGGVAIAIPGDWFVRAEYRRRDQQAVTIQQGLVGLGYRF